jgi:hypothetical protein
VSSQLQAPTAVPPNKQLLLYFKENVRQSPESIWNFIQEQSFLQLLGTEHWISQTIAYLLHQHHYTGSIIFAYTKDYVPLARMSNVARDMF